MATTAPASDYDRFADIYNRHWGKEFSERVQPVLEACLLRHLPAGARVLDVCCGAGHIAAWLVQRGLRVTGLDSSQQMLRHARGNAPGAEFLAGDVRALELPRVFDAAVSTFNSLAHMPSLDDLRCALGNVRGWLQPGAPFLFDLSMEEAYASRWRGSFAMVGADHACIVRPSYDPGPRIGSNHITVFYRDGAWRRADLIITQKCYSEQELRWALESAGFSATRSFDSERDLGIEGDAGRRFFLAWAGDPM